MELNKKQFKYANSSDYKKALENRQPGEKKHEHEWDEDPQPNNWGRMPDALACTVPGCTKEKVFADRDYREDGTFVDYPEEIRERKS